MSRPYNPAVAAYKRMDLDALAKLENNQPIEKGNGLLSRSTMNKTKSGLDYSNPAVRIAKRMQAIRKYREETNGIA